MLLDHNTELVLTMCRHRRAIITSLLSHAVAWRSYAARNSLLAVYTSINDPTVLREVLPLLSPLADEASDESAWLAALPAKDQVSYIHLLLSCVKPSSVSVLNEMESPAWALVQTITSSTATSSEYFAVCFPACIDQSSRYRRGDETADFDPNGKRSVLWSQPGPQVRVHRSTSEVVVGSSNRESTANLRSRLG